MALTLIATGQGCHVVTEGGVRAVELTGRSVSVLRRAPTGFCLAVVDDREVWRRDPGGAWSQVAACPLPLQSLVATPAGQVFGGGRDEAALLRLTGTTMERVPGFDHVPGRPTWFAGGPPLGVRTLASTADGAALLAGVHVGGVPRSADDGATWVPTLPVAHDVHELAAHPMQPGWVVAAAAVGLCVSADGGQNWRVLRAGLPAGTVLAAAFRGDEALFSHQAGPFAARSQLWRWRSGRPGIEPVGHGLPEWLQGKVDTGNIAAHGGAAAVADQGGSVWFSAAAGSPWAQIATGLPAVLGVVVL
jgi:hypothetical protein